MDSDVARFSVLMTPAEGMRFASYCRERGHKKSTLAARLIRERLDKEGFQPSSSPLPDAKAGTGPHRSRARDGQNA